MSTIAIVILKEKFKKNKKLLDTFILNKNKIHYGVPPKDLYEGCLFSNRLNELYFFNGKNWEKIF